VVTRRKQPPHGLPASSPHCVCTVEGVMAVYKLCGSTQGCIICTVWRGTYGVHMTLEGHLPVYLWGVIESPYLLPRKFIRLDFRLLVVWVHVGLCSCDVRTSVCLIDPYADCCSAVVRYSSTAVHRYPRIALSQQYMCITPVHL